MNAAGQLTAENVHILHCTLLAIGAPLAFIGVALVALFALD